MSKCEDCETSYCRNKECFYWDENQNEENQNRYTEDEDTGVCAKCPAAPDCDYASENAPRCYRKNK